ncbi:MAG: hypothetical protein Q8R13_04165 [bacterium]|nr:hypothetical protein [bacterium]
MTGVFFALSPSTKDLPTLYHRKRRMRWHFYDSGSDIVQPPQQRTIGLTDTKKKIADLLFGATTLCSLFSLS